LLDRTALAIRSQKGLVPTAATFFGVPMFILSGVINVPLLLIVRPQLLLFTNPVFVEPEIELAPRSTGYGNFSEPAEYR
jgi:hypothetical protein